MINDKKILKNLVEKYGKDEVLNTINEAFKSSQLSKFAKSIKDERREAKAAADARRLERNDKAYRYHYNGEDVEMDQFFYGMNRDNKGAGDKDAYLRTGQDIQRSYEREIHDIIPSLNTLFDTYGGNFIKWSEIEDTDFAGPFEPEYAGKYTRDTYNMTKVIFWILKNGRVAAITTGKNVIYARDMFKGWSGSRRRGSYSANPKDLAKDDRIDSAYVINLKGKSDLTNRYKMHSDRLLSRRDMIENTPEQNAQIVKNNIERYKRIIAKNKLTQYDEIDKSVRNAIKDIAKYISLDDSNLKVVFKLNKQVQTLLSFYDDFLYYKKNIETMSGSDASWNQRYIKENAANIKSVISDINKLLEENK